SSRYVHGDGDARVGVTGGERVRARAGERGQGAAPARAAHGGDGQAGGRILGDGDRGAVGGPVAGVGDRDRVLLAGVALAEGAGVRLGDLQLGVLRDRGGIAGRVARARAAAAAVHGGVVGHVRGS